MAVFCEDQLYRESAMIVSCPPSPCSCNALSQSRVYLHTHKHGRRNLRCDNQVKLSEGELSATVH